MDARSCPDNTLFEVHAGFDLDTGPTPGLARPQPTSLRCQVIAKGAHIKKTIADLSRGQPPPGTQQGHIKITNQTALLWQKTSGRACDPLGTHKVRRAGLGLPASKVAQPHNTPLRTQADGSQSRRTHRSMAKYSQRSVTLATFGLQQRQVHCGHDVAIHDHDVAVTQQRRCRSNPAGCAQDRMLHRNLDLGLCCGPGLHLLGQMVGVHDHFGGAGLPQHRHRPLKRMTIAERYQRLGTTVR